MIDTAWSFVDEVEAMDMGSGSLDALQNAKLSLAANVLSGAAGVLVGGMHKDFQTFVNVPPPRTVTSQ